MTNRQPLCVRVSKEAYDKLSEIAAAEDQEKWKVLSRMITNSIVRDNTGAAAYRSLIDEDLFGSEHISNRYKASKGEKQLNYQISSAASERINQYKRIAYFSKARVIQSLILRYKPKRKRGH